MQYSRNEYGRQFPGGIFVAVIYHFMLFEIQFVLYYSTLYVLLIKVVFYLQCHCNFTIHVVFSLNLHVSLHILTKICIMPSKMPRVSRLLV